MVGLPGDNINSYYRTSIKNCCAPGRIECAPGMKYLDTPVYAFGECHICSNVLRKHCRTFTNVLMI